jgi:NitT/TauT family transport system substrate-binding protein
MLRTIRRAAALVTLALLAGCTTTAPAPDATSSPAEATTAATAVAEPATIRIASLKGPTTMGMVRLMADAEAGETTHDYQVTMYGTADEVVPLVVQGQVDIALVPANLAAVLYNRTEGAVQVAAINTLGVLYVVETGETIESVADLADRTVYSTGKGTSPEYVLNHILTENGLDPATDLTVEFRSEATELAVLLAEADDAVAVLPQPYVTIVQSQNPEVRVALSLTDEWDAVSPESGLVTGVLLVRRDFAEANDAALADFLTDYEASTAWTNENVPEAAELVAGYGIVPAAPLAEKAIPLSNITFIDGEELRSTLGGYLEVLFAANPESVGGALPSDDFYR